MEETQPGHKNDGMEDARYVYSSGLNTMKSLESHVIGRQRDTII